MDVTFTISPDLEAQIADYARDSGVSVDAVAERLLDRHLRQLSASRRALDEAAKEMRAAFKASGMTEDELSEFLETEKHAMRAERRAKAS